MSARPDFSKVRLAPRELDIIREAYAETYPIRTLLNHLDELSAALRRVQTALSETPTYWNGLKAEINRVLVSLEGTRCGE